jgi:hypothetical protein
MSLRTRSLGRLRDAEVETSLGFHYLGERMILVWYLSTRCE